MIDITFTARGNPFDGLDKFIKRLERPGNGDVRKVADAIAQGFAENFSNEGSAAGPWRQLAPFTVRERQRLGFPGAHPILRRTGRGRASFIQRGATDHIEDFHTTGSGWELSVGSRSSVMIEMEEGTDRIPSRPISPLMDSAQVRIGDVLVFVVEQAERATLGR